MKKKKVLFVCSSQGARSMMAEAFTNHFASRSIEAYSACVRPGKIHALPLRLIREIGISPPLETPKSVHQRYLNMDSYDFVILLCNGFSSENYPVLYSGMDHNWHKKSKQLCWSIPDINLQIDIDREIKNAAISVRNEIESKVISFLEENDISINRPSAGIEQLFAFNQSRNNYTSLAY